VSFLFHTTHLASFPSVSSIQIVTDSLGSLLVDSLALCPTEDDIPLLTELSNLGKTSLAPNTVTMLSFVRRLVEIHGERAELKPNATSGEAAVQGIVKELIILAYDAVETKTQQQDIVSPMFDTLSTCAEKCPILLLSLSREGQQVGGLIRSSVDAAPGILKGSEVDDSLSAINFLRALVSVEVYYACCVVSRFAVPNLSTLFCIR
jgi:hypothetical protein